MLILNQERRTKPNKHKELQVNVTKNIIESLLREYNPRRRVSRSPMQPYDAFLNHPQTTKFDAKRFFDHDSSEETYFNVKTGRSGKFQFPLETSEDSNLKTEVEVQQSDYMLNQLQIQKIVDQYTRYKRPKMMRLNDPLIDEGVMQIKFTEQCLIDLCFRDLIQKVPFLWQCSSDEYTTASGSSDERDKTQVFKEKFMVGKQIGAGSYATVRQCIDRTTLKTYALKIYSKFSLTASRKKSILREIRLLQHIKHPNIIKIYDAIETNNHVNLVLELVQGQSLAAIYKAKQLTLPQIKHIIHQVASALAYLHGLHITHRDIKLENILYIPEKREIKIIDFGFSTLMRSRKKMFCGTPSYMAPEIVRRTIYKGQPVDIWALGVTLYTLICQHFPFKGTNDKDLYSKISFGEYKTDLIENEDVKDLIQRMLRIDPEQRITAEQVSDSILMVRF